MGNYFKQRIYEELGATDADLQIQLKGWNYENDTDYKVDTMSFREDRDGNIVIPVYDINRNLLYFENPDDTGRMGEGRAYKSIEIIRYAQPKTVKDPKTGEEKTCKYKYPKGAESRPYFPKLILEMYEKRQDCKTLILTEGYFKSFKACMHGIPCIGLQSISTYREKKSGAMFKDIIDFIERCNVKNVVMLYDCDCFDISQKALQQHKDLYTRPAGFIGSCENIRELFKDFNVDFYFSCVNTQAHDSHPKGLDDLLIAMRGKEKDVVDDLMKIGHMTKYFFRENCTRKMTKVYNFFCCQNVDSFYSLHEDKIGTEEFVFKATRYRFDLEKQSVVAILNRNLSNFCRIGDDYYELVLIPNQYGQIDAELKGRRKGTITDDFGKEAIHKIPKYKAFCNVPNHIQYQAVIHDCYNLYNKFTHEPVEGDCEYSLMLVKHIFGEKYYEMGLDYIQLLYQKPTEMLPVLCLVSKENKTGKSTFAKWLREIFGLNAIFVSSQDFSENFNFHWAGKLLIMCEETELDKSFVMDRVKSLSTADKVTMNRKGKDHEQVAFFGKFILCSNNEEKFIKAGKNDERYFVLKVNPIENLDPFFSQKLYAEIPHFLNYLNNRTLSYPKKLDRMWFPAKDYRTEAFERVIAANRTKAERDIRSFIHDIFMEYNFYTMYEGKPGLLMDFNYIHKELLNGKYDRDYLRQVLEDMPWQHYEKNGERPCKRFKIPYWDKGILDAGVVTMYNQYVGRPLVFLAEDYLTSEEFENLKKSNPEYFE